MCISIFSLLCLNARNISNCNPPVKSAPHVQCWKASNCNCTIFLHNRTRNNFHIKSKNILAAQLDVHCGNCKLYCCNNILCFKITLGISQFPHEICPSRNLINTRRGQRGLLMEPEFNLERTSSAPLIITRGLKYGRWNFPFVTQTELFPPVDFYTFYYLVKGRGKGGERPRGGSGRARGKVIREFECQLRTRLTTTLHNWLPAGQTTPLFSSFFTAVPSPSLMEHTHSHTHLHVHQDKFFCTPKLDVSVFFSLLFFPFSLALCLSCSSEMKIKQH